MGQGNCLGRRNAALTRVRQLHTATCLHSYPSAPHLPMLRLQTYLYQRLLLNTHSCATNCCGSGNARAGGQALGHIYLGKMQPTGHGCDAALAAHGLCASPLVLMTPSCFQIHRCYWELLCHTHPKRQFHF